jgi:hypothetical protein
MKTIYMCLFALFLVSFSSRAQLTLTKAANEAVAGDVTMIVNFDSTTAIPKSKGTGQMWNFTSLNNPGTFTETTTYTTVASTPGASLFPGATLSAKIGSNDYEYYKSSGSNWEFMGDYDMSGPDQLVLSNTAVFQVWPISLGSSNTDMASGTTSSGSSSTAISATITYSATGTGTVVMPNGNIHNNCLQVITSLTLSLGSGTSAATEYQTTYDYYSSAKKFSIVQIQYNTTIDATGTQKGYSANVDNSGVTVGLNSTKPEDLEFTVFPVPAGNQLNVKLPNAELISKIEIFDMSGKLLISETNTNKVDVSALKESSYLIRVISDKKTYQQMLPVIK